MMCIGMKWIYYCIFLVLTSIITCDSIGYMIVSSTPKAHISVVALVGGGTNPHPGEISLAHNGVLFLDELPEYKRSVLEVMRQPLEDRHITVARTKETVDYPASFMLVAAMNPCPCGHYGENNPAHPCTCTPAQVHRYLSKISGPLLDRIDIQCEIVNFLFLDLRVY